MTDNRCEYCYSPGAPAVSEEAHVCASCFRLLKDPVLGLRLLRGHMTMRLRGTGPEPRVRRTVEAAMRQFEAMAELAARGSRRDPRSPRGPGS